MKVYFLLFKSSSPSYQRPKLYVISTHVFLCVYINVEIFDVMI